MRSLGIVFLFLLLTVINCDDHSRSAGFYRMKERSIRRESFQRMDRSDPNSKQTLIFAIKQKNLEYLSNLLVELSTPSNDNFQKWLTFGEVEDIIKNSEATESVLKWLTNQQNASVLWVSRRGEYIKAEHTIEKWNELLETDFYDFKDMTREGSKNIFSRSNGYSIPIELVDHISAVFNTVQVPLAMKAKYRTKAKMPFKTHGQVQLRREEKVSSSSSNGVVTVPFINSFYKISSNLGSSDLSQSVFETSMESFSQKDLRQFQTQYSLTLQEAIDYGGYNITDCTENTCGEGNLDIQYIMGVAQKTTSIYWYTEDSNDAYAQWITDVANDPNPPSANSMSWGGDEYETSTSVMESFNTEAMKLSIMGVTVTVASGDNGAPGSGAVCNCLLNSGSSGSPWTGSNTWKGEGYFPSFPATSPYVTAVGATMGPEDGSAEISCQSNLGGVISSGGGFSVYYPQPSWQTNAVNSYFSSLSSSETPTGGYNIQGRAYPDVSLIGVEFQVVIGGETVSVFGTSCSSPTFAAFVSLLNAFRYERKLPTLGFLNPTLWASSSTKYFNDINSGSNKCCAFSGVNYNDATCCASGFYTADGWDPVTGWGSIDFTNFAAMFNNTVDYIEPSSTSNSEGLSAGAIAGIVIGATMGVALFMLAIILCFFSGLKWPAFGKSTPAGTSSPSTIQNPIVDM